MKSTLPILLDELPPLSTAIYHCDMRLVGAGCPRRLVTMTIDDQKVDANQLVLVHEVLVNGSSRIDCSLLPPDAKAFNTMMSNSARVIVCEGEQLSFKLQNTAEVPVHVVVLLDVQPDAPFAGEPS